MKKMEHNADSNLQEALENPVTEHPVTDKDILVFAKQILACLFIAFISCILGGILSHAKILFDIAKVEIFPAFTLVAGYYFLKKN